MKQIRVNSGCIIEIQKIEEWQSIKPAILLKIMATANGALCPMDIETAKEIRDELSRAIDREPEISPGARYR